ncbi:tetratricopeptide repeat protein [Rhodanobacter sp. Col0626]|uniref:tetratricopeptide repeat protein n=1 Tax=Rhodanobacter sp. Col0626 TaxID=3415679 RepID=UPI003CEE0F9F
MRHRLATLPLALLPLVLVLVWICYAPGLHGGFLFDDFGNLPALGASGPIDRWSTFWRYITSGIADPTGRPLTLLTFLLDARDWPADPLPFKRTNLVLHLLNGVLLYALLARFGQALAMESMRYRLAALVGATLWLLHPLLVSTTLYIVQREAMLPATCVLAGLLIWLHGRSKLASGNIAAGVAWGILGLGGFTLLGTLAKANGALLPLYALLIEKILLAARQPLTTDHAQRAQRALSLIFMLTPALAIGTYLGWVGVHGIIVGGPASRPWNYAQRLLTEPRVLIDYLQLLWLPRPFSSGLFNDQYSASISLWHPLSTLLALVTVIALIVGAWRLRGRYPAWALTVLFYFAGHLLESTSIPLELYFEHRNYIPALLMFWPLGLWLADGRSLRIPKRTLLICLPLGLAWMTHVRAELWGDVDRQASIWVQINPNSPRAQANLAAIEMESGHPQRAINRLEKLLAAQPEQAQLAFNLIGARCMTGGVGATDLVAANAAMRKTANVGALLSHWFDRILPTVMAGGCPGLTPSELLGLIHSGLQNPALSAAGPRQDLIYLRGRIALAEHQPDSALADFTQALDLQVRPGMALQAAATLGTAGYPAQGLQLLDHYQNVQKNVMAPGVGMPMIHDWILDRQHYWPLELSRLRALLDRQNRAAAITPTASFSMHQPDDMRSASL